MHTVDVVIPVLWVVFWVYWLAAAFNTKGTSRRSMSSVPLRLAIIVIIVASVHAHVFSSHSVTTIDDPWLEGFGTAVFVAGLALAVWARVYLGRNWGTPMSERIDPDLITTGPYRFVRHPIYTGIILAFAGTTMAVSLYWVLPLVLVGAYFVYSATVEEHTMLRAFPDAYPAYRKRTKMLIPFVF